MYVLNIGFARNMRAKVCLAPCTRFILVYGVRIYFLTALIRMIYYGMNKSQSVIESWTIAVSEWIEIDGRMDDCGAIRKRIGSIYCIYVFGTLLTH